MSKYDQYVMDARVCPIRVALIVSELSRHLCDSQTSPGVRLCDSQTSPGLRLEAKVTSLPNSERKICDDLDSQTKKFLKRT
jgi:hypothetical protein